MDSKRFNIYAGSVLGAVLLFLLLNFFSQLIFVGPEHAGHEEEVLAFAVPVEEAGGAGEPEEVDLAALVADADPGAGERVFNRCRACHALEDGQHGVGPSLHGVVGRDIASAEGFEYSSALTDLEGAWDLEALAGFLADPRGYAPGTNMNFAGIGDPDDLVNVIVFLNEADDSPVELVSEETAEAAEAEEAEEDAAEGEEAEGESADEGEEGQAQDDDAQDDDAQNDDAQEGDAADGEPGAGSGESEYAELLEAADAENGQKAFRKCQACHTLEEGVHRVGPSLWGVVGREVAGADGFDYSDAMKSFEGDWTLGNLDAYLENPREFMPGNKMTFPGLRDAQERIDVITYINEADGSPEPLQ